MNTIARQAVEQAVYSVLGAGGLCWASDANGNAFGWIRPCASNILPGLARGLAGIEARLLTVTAYRNDKFGRLDGREIAYHFDLDGVVVTATISLDDACPKVPSITPWFQNADWNEREFAELYGIEVEDHPNPRRLFLDKDLDGDILDRMIPLSTLMNGASTTTLWEKVFAGKPMPAWTKGEQN